MIYNAYCTRPSDRVGGKTVLQGITDEPELDDPDYNDKIYRSSDYFHFVISEEMKSWLDSKSGFYVKFNLVALRAYFMENDLNHVAFFDDISNDNELITTGETLDFLKGYLSYTPKEEAE